MFLLGVFWLWGAWDTQEWVVFATAVQPDGTQIRATSGWQITFGLFEYATWHAKPSSLFGPRQHSLEFDPVRYMLTMAVSLMVLLMTFSRSQPIEGDD